jgi:hypothetical protein
LWRDILALRFFALFLLGQQIPLIRNFFKHLAKQGHIGVFGAMTAVQRLRSAFFGGKKGGHAARFSKGAHYRLFFLLGRLDLLLLLNDRLAGFLHHIGDGCYDGCKVGLGTIG